MDREDELAYAVSVINDICESYNINLIPYVLEDGTELIIIEDNQTGELYVL